MVTLQSAENALKSVYLGAITELLNTKANPLLAKIEQTSTDVWGKEIRKAVSFGLNGGIGAGDEDSDLPAAHGKQYFQFVSTLKNLYGQIEISDKAIRASADGRGAFTDLLNAELQSLLEASKFNLGRMLYGSNSGLLASVDEDVPTGYKLNRTFNLIEGMVVDVYYYTNVLTHKGLRIKSVDRVNNIIAFNETDIGPLENSKLYVQGSKDKELTGMDAIFNNEYLYGIKRNLSESFMMPLNTLVNGPIDDIIIQKAIDDLENSANSTVDFLACSANVKYAYQEYLGQFKRNIDIMELEGGFKTLSFNGIPLVYERFIKDDEMFLLNTKILKLHQLCDWRYLETENGKILRQNQGKPTYSATLVKYCDLICDKPNGIGKLRKITRA